MVGEIELLLIEDGVDGWDKEAGDRERPSPGGERGVPVSAVAKSRRERRE